METKLRRPKDPMTELWLNITRLQDSTSKSWSCRRGLSSFQVSLNVTRSLATGSVHTRRIDESLLIERKTNQNWGGRCPAHLRKQQSALAGLETLGARSVQRGVSDLFTSVSTGESKLGTRAVNCIRL